MSIARNLTANPGLKLVSLCLALLLWLVTTSGTETEIGIKVPVRYLNLSPGMTVVDTPPKVVDVTIAGPKILLWLLDKDPPVLAIDLQGAGTGNLKLTGLEGRIRVDRGLRITSVYPSTIELKVRKTEKSSPS